MIRNRRTFFRHIAAALVLSAAALGTSPARADAGFQNWINEFYATAAKAGITKATYRQAFSGVKTPDQTVIEKANYQPEFKHKIWEYIDSRVNPYTKRVGQEMAAKHARKGRNPQTGEEIVIAGRRVLTFKASQVLKKTMNDGTPARDAQGG